MQQQVMMQRAMQLQQQQQAAPNRLPAKLIDTPDGDYDKVMEHILRKNRRSPRKATSRLKGAVARFFGHIFH